MKKLLFKKHKGISDLVASLLAIFALALMLFMFIFAVGDVYTKIELDQIARKYILRIESSGELSSEDAAAIKSEVLSISSVEKVDPSGTNIIVTWGTSEGTATKGNYGSTITLSISCQAAVTKYFTPAHDDDAAFNGLFGSITHKETATYFVTKQSTAKY